MKLSWSAVGAWLCLAPLLTGAGASRLSSEAKVEFHPKNHSGHKSGKSHRRPKHGAAKSPSKAPGKGGATSALQAPPAPVAAHADAAKPPAAKAPAPEAPQQPPAAAQESAQRVALPAVAAAVAVVEPAAPVVLSIPMPTVPVAPRGVPQLPAVSSMLGSAAETLKQINSQANILEARVVQTQMENEARMARQKAVFEQKLKQQDEENHGIDIVNAGISQEIGNLKKSNLETEKHAKELQATNHMMRVELAALKAKLSVSKEFLATSLLSTDDSKAGELDILSEGKAKKQRKVHVASAAQVHESQDKEVVQDDDEADDDDAESQEDDVDDGDARGTSFLALKSSTMATSGSIRSDVTEEASEALAEVQLPGADQATTDPRDLLKVLSNGVESLEAEEKDGEAKLKAMFLQNFREGAKRKKALLLQQKQLNATKASLLDYQAKLQAADGHLQGTRGKLEQRLRGLGTFLQKLAAVAMGPVSNAAAQLKDLPTGVSIPDGPADGGVSAEVVPTTVVEGAVTPA